MEAVRGLLRIINWQVLTIDQQLILGRLISSEDSGLSQSIASFIDKTQLILRLRIIRARMSRVNVVRLNVDLANVASIAAIGLQHEA